MLSETRLKIKEQYAAFIGRKILFTLLLLILVLFLLGFSATLSSADIGITEAYAAILNRLLPDNFDAGWLAKTVLWELRLPRILIGIVAGAGLAVAGTAMQGILAPAPPFFGNFWRIADNVHI